MSLAALDSCFAQASDALRRTQPLRLSGVVVAVRGLSVVVEDLAAPVGSLVSICREHGLSDALVYGEVVGFSSGQAIVMLLSQATGIRAGDRVVCEQVDPTARVGPGLLGRVVDGFGRAIDSRGAVGPGPARLLSPEPIGAMKRRRITRAMHTGLRAIDLFLTLGKGQRIGVFAGPGVGKSTLMGTIAKRSAAHVNVIALIGERGREVKDFIEHSLGAEGLAKSVVVVATGDESPLLRLRAARLACTAAEYFRDAGLDVMLMMDSITRFAHAQRQVGLSVGEPPATKGYTPSVFAQMALLLERAGALEATGVGSVAGGSITGLYTILVEGDDMTEPIADAARGILDGHIILSRKLAQKAHYPAIDVLDSVSRVADDVCDEEHIRARQQVLRLLAIYREVEDLVQIGAYARGSNPEADVAIDLHPQLNELLRQGKGDATPFDVSRATLLKLAATAGEMRKGKGARRP
jgi:FliI/YscN family ATPase